MDALEALGDDSRDAEQLGALGSPVTRGAGAVFGTADDDERDALLLVVDRGVVDRRLRSALLGEVASEAALHAVEQQVLQTDVGEGSADHDLVVAAARAVGIEVLALNTVLLQVLAGRGVGLEGTCRGDVVGRDRISQECEHAGAGDVLDGLRVHRHAVEVGRLAHVGGLVVPLEQVTRRGFEPLPALVTVEDGAVFLGEHAGVDRLVDRALDLLGSRPDVLEEHVDAVFVLAQRLVLEVEVHRSGQRVGDDERRRGQVVHLDVGADAALEVAVARKHRSD